MGASNTVVAAPQAAFNFDCLYQFPIFKGYRVFYIKVLVTILTPIFIFFLIFIFNYIVVYKLFKKPEKRNTGDIEYEDRVQIEREKAWGRAKQNIILSSTILVFLVHTNVVM